MIPLIKPAKSGAPEANAIPKHKGIATKKTTILAGISSLKFFNGLKFLFIIVLFNFLNLLV